MPGSVVMILIYSEDVSVVWTNKPTFSDHLDQNQHQQNNLNIIRNKYIIYINNHRSRKISIARWKNIKLHYYKIKQWYQ